MQSQGSIIIALLSSTRIHGSFLKYQSRSACQTRCGVLRCDCVHFRPHAGNLASNTIVLSFDFPFSRHLIQRRLSPNQQSRFRTFLKGFNGPPVIQHQSLYTYTHRHTHTHTHTRTPTHTHTHTHTNAHTHKHTHNRARARASPIPVKRHVQRRYAERHSVCGGSSLAQE
jgi:hypothetical protein